MCRVTALPPPVSLRTSRNHGWLDSRVPRTASFNFAVNTRVNGAGVRTAADVPRRRDGGVESRDRPTLAAWKMISLSRCPPSPVIKPRHRFPAWRAAAGTKSNVRTRAATRPADRVMHRPSPRRWRLLAARIDLPVAPRRIPI